MGLFVRKPLNILLTETEEHDASLKKTLGAWGLVALGIGAIIGAGLFSITGAAAANNAGPAITISFIIAALGCAFAGLCYAEFASMIPVAGSAYTYSYATMGEFIAWIIGWDLVLEYAVGAATVAISWSRYLHKFLEGFGIHLPNNLMAGPWDGGMINLPAVLVVVLMSLLLIRGTKESAMVNSIIVALKVSVVLIFIILGWGYINYSNYDPYIPPNEGNGIFGFSGIMRAAGIVFFAYIGFDAVSTAAQEAKNPGKDMPKGILISLLICTLLYILFAHVMTGVTSYKSFQGQDGIAPVAVAIEHMGKADANGVYHADYPWLNRAIIVAILAGYMSVILVMLMGQSRVFYSMSRDGLVPKVFSKVHPVYRTPSRNNLVFMLLVSLFAAFIPARIVGEMTSIGTLFAFILVCIGIIVMRKALPNAPRAFKTPLVPFIPIMGVITCLYMMIALPPDTWIRLILWMIIGMDIYLTYGAGKSRLGNGTFNRKGMSIAILSSIVLCILLFLSAWWHHYDLTQQAAIAVSKLSEAQTQQLPTVTELSAKLDAINDTIKNDYLVEIANVIGIMHILFFGYLYIKRQRQKKKQHI
ncbi:amino acid permease [Niabella aquatica]